MNCNCEGKLDHQYGCIYFSNQPKRSQILNFCTICGGEVFLNCLREHAEQHNPNFSDVPWEVLETEVFEQVSESDFQDE